MPGDVLVDPRYPLRLVAPRVVREDFLAEIGRDFWNNVRMQADGCWVWTGRTNGDGYGIYRGGSAHRWAYWLSQGYLPSPDVVVMHSCDNPPCCRPEHLSAGTRADNNADMVRKGRARWVGPINPRRGATHPNAKLTQPMADDIRRIYAAGGVTMKGLAEEFEVSYTSIWQVIHEETWSG